MAFIGETTLPVWTGTGAVPTALAQVQPTGSASGTVQSNPTPSDTRHVTERQAPASAYAWLLAWGVMLAFLALVNRSRIGHAAIYYALLLMLFFVIVSNYRFIQTSLAPFQTLGNSQGTQGR